MPELRGVLGVLFLGGLGQVRRREQPNVLARLLVLSHAPRPAYGVPDEKKNNTHHITSTSTITVAHIHTHTRTPTETMRTHPDQRE